jgi:hypothetical protein
MQQIIRLERDELAVWRGKAGERPLDICEAEVGADDEEADFFQSAAAAAEALPGRTCPQTMRGAAWPALRRL